MSDKTIFIEMAKIKCQHMKLSTFKTSKKQNISGIFKSTNNSSQNIHSNSNKKVIVLYTMKLTN